jgi:hypothetical protein
LKCVPPLIIDYRCACLYWVVWLRVALTEQPFVWKTFHHFKISLDCICFRRSACYFKYSPCIKQLVRSLAIIYINLIIGGDAFSAFAQLSLLLLHAFINLRPSIHADLHARREHMHIDDQQAKMAWWL